MILPDAITSTDAPTTPHVPEELPAYQPSPSQSLSNPHPGSQSRTRPLPPVPIPSGLARQPSEREEQWADGFISPTDAAA
ncbi:hypothetical protein BT69DRAFT_1335584, partial [Atractiella rhizophila]